jgi:hypothetical protein
VDEGKMKYNVDKVSFELGMINCFAEMVSCGVKKLAISPPLSPENYDVIGPLSDEIVRGFGIRSFLEKSLLITDLQTEDFTRGKWSILYYENESVLKDYLALKKKKMRLEDMGKYNEPERKAISREFMRLLSYPDNKIEEKLSKADPSDPFILTER